MASIQLPRLVTCHGTFRTLDVHVGLAGSSGTPRVEPDPRGAKHVDYPD